MAYWANYSWLGTPFERGPWGKRRLKYWLAVEAGELPLAILPKDERTLYFRWYRWKHGLPKGPRPEPGKVVFYQDDEGRIRRFVTR
jgi:hypothetical protein